MPCAGVINYCDGFGKLRSQFQRCFAGRKMATSGLAAMASAALTILYCLPFKAHFLTDALFRSNGDEFINREIPFGQYLGAFCFPPARWRQQQQLSFFNQIFG